MEESKLKMAGLVPLSEEEMKISGGFNWKKALEFVERVIDIIDKAEKYWPSFRDGFKKGWEAA
ncbi:MAG: hypothetical protein QMB39_03345 [Bacteroidales bacterium]|jgi:hypothetical protein